MKFVGSSLDDLRNFPDVARRVIGFELRAIQNGLEPSDWRVIYIDKLADAVYVLYAFQKKTRKTSVNDIELARKRLKQIGGNL